MLCSQVLQKVQFRTDLISRRLSDVVIQAAELFPRSVETTAATKHHYLWQEAADQMIFKWIRYWTCEHNLRRQQLSRERPWRTAVFATLHSFISRRSPTVDSPAAAVLLRRDLSGSETSDLQANAPLLTLAQPSQNSASASKHKHSWQRIRFSGGNCSTPPLLFFSSIPTTRL